MTSTTDSKDKKKQHREQLKNIKKKYGLTVMILSVTSMSIVKTTCIL